MPSCYATLPQREMLLKIAVTFCLAVVSHAVLIRPVKFPNGTIGAMRVETGDALFTADGRARMPDDPSSQSKFDIPLTQRDIAWLDSVLALPLHGEVRVRKEYRTLTDEERNRFHRAVNILKIDTSVSLNKYDLLANIHARTSSSAHAGPGFLGWHRVFLLMFENALRQVDPEVTVPYWDITLEEGMVRPYLSSLFSPLFLGSGHGQVLDGPFQNWVTPFGYGPLRRQIVAQGRLISPEQIERILNKTHLAEISYFTANLEDNFEAIHNNVHVWVGGQMRNIEIGAVDPIFYLIHSFVDMIWTEFRVNQMTHGVNPQTDFPYYYGPVNQAPLAPMGLGPLVVIDGLNDVWHEQVFYDPRPICKGVIVCGGSAYLKCDETRDRCVALTTEELFRMPTEPSTPQQTGNNPVVQQGEIIGKVKDEELPFSRDELISQILGQKKDDVTVTNRTQPLVNHEESKETTAAPSGVQPEELSTINTDPSPAQNIQLTVNTSNEQIENNTNTWESVKLVKPPVLVTVNENSGNVSTTESPTNLKNFSSTVASDLNGDINRVNSQNDTENELKVATNLPTELNTELKLQISEEITTPFISKENKNVINENKNKEISPNLESSQPAPLPIPAPPTNV